jgi:hypothetical protein
LANPVNGDDRVTAVVPAFFLVQPEGVDASWKLGKSGSGLEYQGLEFEDLTPISITPVK